MIHTDGIALAKARSSSVAKSLSHVGNVVVRCQDTACTRVQAVNATYGILNPCHLLPLSFGAQSVF